MSHNRTMIRILRVATLAMMMSAISVHAQSEKGSASSRLGDAGADTKDASGKTQANREGRMSPTGQNATSSVAPRKAPEAPGSTSGTIGKSGGASGGTGPGRMGDHGANTKDASGKTKANREGRMSPTGQNESTAITPKAGSASSSK